MIISVIVTATIVDNLVFIFYYYITYYIASNIRGFSIRFGVEPRRPRLDFVFIFCARIKYLHISEVKTMSEAKKKKRQYSAEYIKYGFIQSRSNLSSPMCLICQKTFSNEAMKPSRMLDHFNKMHSNMKDKDVTYFQNMEKKYVAQPTLSTVFFCGF